MGKKDGGLIYTKVFEIKSALLLTFVYSVKGKRTAGG